MVIFDAGYYMLEIILILFKVFSVYLPIWAILRRGLLALSIISAFRSTLGRRFSRQLRTEAGVIIFIVGQIAFGSQ